MSGIRVSREIAGLRWKGARLLVNVNLSVSLGGSQTLFHVKHGADDAAETCLFLHDAWDGLVYPAPLCRAQYGAVTRPRSLGDGAVRDVSRETRCLRGGGRALRPGYLLG